MSIAKKGHHRAITRCLTGNFALMLMLAFVLAFSLVAPTAAYPVTSAEKQAEADEMVRQLDTLQTELDQVAQDLEEAAAAQDSALQQMEEAKIREDAAIKRTAELQEQLGNRVAESYRNGNLSYLDVLFGATSFSEFITSMDMIDRLNEHDAQLTQESKDTREEAQDARELYTEQERIAAEKKDEITSLKADMEQKSVDMQAEIERLNEEAAELLAQEEAAAEAARLAAAASAVGTGSVSADQVAALPRFTHPCPTGSYTSGFGWREFTSSFHMGLDIGAPTGTPIYAALGGTVIVAGYSPTAGNWVVISHGNGLVTKYMHASALYVSAGQTVGAGETIAAVGNTGHSFGAHLHFQVEINGSAVNPRPFL
jgi:murein DD-endopeptidase MepM/ murein hydrolase activator NlpD